MSCPGLHCPGCSDGQSIAVGGVVLVGLVLADRASAYVADRIFWIGGTVALCFALAVAAAYCVERWTARRDAERAAAGPLLVVREARPVYQLAPEPRPSLTAPARPAIGPAREVHYHFDVTPGELAAIVRHQAEEGR